MSNWHRAITSPGVTNTAADILRRTLEIDGVFGPAHWFLGKVYGQQGAIEKSVAELELAVAASDRATIFLATLGWALGAAGRSKEAGVVLDELRSRSAREYVSLELLCAGARRAGDRLMTVEALYEAVKERSPFAIWTKVDPIFDSCRDDPGFQALLQSLE